MVDIQTFFVCLNIGVICIENCTLFLNYDTAEQHVYQFSNTSVLNTPQRTAVHESRIEWIDLKKHENR